jgi:hypothetical protein
VQTIDGGRAAIMVGQSLQMPMRQRVFTPAGVLSETLVQRDLGSGFIAVPQLNGERVTIEISPRDDTPGRQPGTINTQQLVTTVSGRLGEWLELGGSVTEHGRQRRRHRRLRHPIGVPPAPTFAEGGGVAVVAPLSLASICIR